MCGKPFPVARSATDVSVCVWGGGEGGAALCVSWWVTGASFSGCVPPRGRLHVDRWFFAFLQIVSILNCAYGPPGRSLLSFFLEDD